MSTTITDYKTLYEKTSPGKLFRIVTIPGVVSMLVSSLYGIVDGIFVGKLLGSLAFAAVNLVMPFIILDFAIADLVGVGSAVLIAIKLGEKNELAASKIFSAACLIIIVCGFILGTFLFIFADKLIGLMGAQGELLELSVEYLRVYAGFSPFITILFAVDNYLRICGRVRYSMVVNILMAAIGAVLEFLFLYVFRSGIWGASLAFCCAMVICVVIAMIPFIRGKMQLKFVKAQIDKETLRNIFANGSPSFFNNVAGRIASILMNLFLLRIGGAIAVSAYGVLMYADGFVQPVLYGLCDSLQPAIGYNYGAKNYRRIFAIEKLCFIVCGLLSLIMTIAMFFGRGAVINIFINANEMELINLSIHAFSIFLVTFIFRWVSMATQSYMSAIGKAGNATIISLSTAFVFPVILLFALEFLGLDGIWLNMPITCILAALVSVVILTSHYRKEIRVNLKSEKAKDNDALKGIKETEN